MADRLIVWDPDTKSEIAANYFSWGNVARNSTDDVTFHIKNESDEYRAKGVTVKSIDISGNPGLAAQHLFSVDGWVYTDILSVGDIVPHGVTPEITLRRVTRGDATSGQFSIVVESSTWMIQQADIQQEVVSEVGSDS